MDKQRRSDRDKERQKMSDEQKPVYDYKHSIECRDCGDKVVIHCNRVDLIEYTLRFASASEAMPYLSREDREILISNTCPKCYEEVFGGDEAEEEQA